LHDYKVVNIEQLSCGSTHAGRNFLRYPDARDGHLSFLRPGLMGRIGAASKTRTAVIRLCLPIFGLREANAA